MAGVSIEKNLTINPRHVQEMEVKVLDASMDQWSLILRMTHDPGKVIYGTEEQIKDLRDKIAGGM